MCPETLQKILILPELYIILMCVCDGKDVLCGCYNQVKYVLVHSNYGRKKFPSKD